MSKPLSQTEISALLGLSVKTEIAAPQQPAQALTAAEIAALLKPVERVNPSSHGFDIAALFLLGLHYENLYEPAHSSNSDGWWWRCKGCTKIIKRSSRKSHHQWHKKELA